MATSRDVQEIVSKLSSDKAKARDEGVRLLSSWLEGERSISFCKLLGRNTAAIKPDEIPHAETWPFLLTLLLKCIALEISACKKRQPKLILAKTLRTAIQCAEDPKLSGKALLLFSVVKVLFDHICDVVKDVPSFQSEYSNILRQLLATNEYRYQMRKRSYCNLVVLYVNKVGMTIGANIQSSFKEEVFRFILTLHVLLENPPGDFPDSIREDLVKGFIKSFSCIRGEGKISRKLMECVNTYLQKDGPNLGFQVMEIHCAVQEFIFHCWLTTRDRGLKDSFILYARVQLKLTRSVTEESHLVEQLLDVIAKELDQSTVAGTGMLRSDTYRDDKVGTLGSTQQHLMELAAAVFYEACINRTKSSFHKKRLKLENVAVLVKDRLMKGLWLWSGAFCFLIRNYSVLLDKSLLVYWFEGACEALQRTLNNLSTVHSYDSLLWLLRALQEFSSVLIFCPSKEKHAQELSFTSNEALLMRNGWNAIWGSLTYKLPMFSKVVSIVDSAFVLLGNVILRDQTDVAVVPQDIWDLQTFKYRPPQSALYFITCYFSKKGFQGDPRDLLHLRKNLLKAAVSLIEFKEPVGLNEQYCMLIPAAIFSLCAGCAPFLPSSVDLFIFLDAKQDLSKLLMEGDDHKLVNEILDCRVEALAEIKIETTVEVQTEHHSSTHLPRSIRQPLICELNDYITGILNLEEEVEKIALSNLIFICSLLCNFIYSSISTRIREQKALFFTEAFKYILRLLDRVVSMVEEKHDELQCRGLSGVSSILDTSGSAFSSFQSLNSCPLFSLGKDGSSIECELLGRVIQSLENLLVALGKLFVELLKCICNLETGINVRPIPVSSLTSPQKSNFLNESTVRIVDMELDADDGSKDTDVLAASERCHSVISFSPVQWRLEIVAAISTFFSVTPFVTWEVLFDLLSKENDSKVFEKIVFSLCKNFPGSAAKLSALISSLNGMMGTSTSLKNCCASIVTAICALLRNLSSLVSAKHNTPNQVASKENLNDLCDLINKVADVGLPDWSARVKLIDCIFYFVQLEPCIAQTMIERLLSMLQDTDYRVRLFLARRIGLLFQTWDGHNELFQDICSNFGFEMVGASKEKLVKAKEVLTDDAQSAPVVETIIVTLVHIALCSEEVEIEAIFMICVVAAIDPCQRKLVYAVLDNLSRQLHYSSRTEYMEELMGSILFRWVACEVSLVSLLEVQDLFVVNSETRHFVQSYCPWLLPPLILSGDISNLDWISKVASQPLPALVKEYFVPIFSVCIALHCSVKPEKEMGQKALHSTILHVTQISERERDDLIKKHMVSIVGFLLSLSSSSIDPKMPFFLKDVVVLSIRTVVDGFVEMDDHSTNVSVIDKINVFRPDRVFKFLVEIHHQITAAVHPRHRCHHLSAIEVLSNIIGNRATLPSTSFYIFSIVGQLIESEPLQNQCCTILSTLLEAFKSSSTKEVVTVFGEQLQFLVSKLLACCITAENTGQTTIDFCPARVLSLLHQLTVDADPSLYDYIRELEPFPEVDCFERIRMFHESLCKAYSARDQFLKFVRRSCYLPQGLVMWSLRTLHRKLLMGEIIHQDTDAGLGLGENNFWNCDLEVVSAIWTLVDLCHSNVENDMSALLADFISRVGVGDPYRVVFHLPGVPSQKHLSWSSYHDSSKEVGFHSDSWVSEELLIDLLVLLKKYLLDDSVKTVDIASRTLRGILSTERGYRALLSLQSYDRSMIEVHSKGVNAKLVEKLLLDFEKTSSEVFSVEDSSLWMTDAKTYETWVCSLVHSLIGHSDDIILRLCQGIVSLKAEAAELLFGNVLLNLAGRIDMSLGLCQLISTKVQEHIFVESNNMVKSVQSFLNVLNRLRTFYVMEKSCSLSEPLKHCKPSSNVKTRSTSERTKHHTSNELFSSSMWKKVYWLSIDYLVIAKAAIRCGSYFTAVMYVEHWCEEHFNGLTLGCPDFSYLESLPPHIELLVAAVTQINEPDSIYGIIQSHKLTSQITMYEHEGNWSKALEYHDLLVRSAEVEDISQLPGKSSAYNPHVTYEKEVTDQWKSYKGLIRSLQKTGCSHVLDVYFHGLMSQRGHFQHDTEFTELQYEAAWRAGNWDFSFLTSEINFPYIGQLGRGGHFNANLHSCLRALQEGDSSEFHIKLRDSKTELVRSLSDASKESTEYLNSTILKVQILDHLGMAWDLRWKSNPQQNESSILKLNQISSEPVIPTKVQLEWLNADWSLILRQTQLNMNLLEPFIAFRRVLLQILDCKECMAEHLLQSASVLRKGSRFSLAASALHELKLLSCQTEQERTCRIYFLGRLEESKLLRAQGQHDLAISLANYILQNYQMEEEEANVHRLVGKWLAETRSSNSRTILEQYLKHSVELAELNKSVDKKSISRRCQTFFHLAHYTDGLFKSYEDRLASSEWQAAMRLRRHKTRELDALIKRLKISTKGEKTDYSIKIQELQKQLTMDREEAEKLQVDRDNFLMLALEGYQRCLVIGGKNDIRVVFRLVSLWFSLSSSETVIKAMLGTVKGVQSYKFIPLVYQIASRLGNPKDGQGSTNFQIALVSLVKKMAIEHPYHTLFQLLALANGDRIKDKQRSRNSFVVDMDKKLAAENLLNELCSCHGEIIVQMKQMVELYIKLAELETKKEETNRKIAVPRDIRSVRQLELVPVVTASIQVDPACQYREGSFPYFMGLADSITIMNGINAPKVVECFGSDGNTYRQLAKSGNDDLRQDAVMEQFFGLVNTFLQNHRDTRKRRLRIRTYKVVPFTPSAGVIEWVDRTIPLGEYLLGSTRNGGAHGRYGVGDWSFLQCREHMANEKDKRKAFLKVCDNFRPVMHYFFLERFLRPAEWFERRLSYTRSVAASSMVGYIVGLGDRHSMNILIDQATAEVVHIDLGVAFEQGLMLKTPERVPFRLTRDIIDGMGVTGVVGVFQRCCEETLSVMRTNKEALLTIIEVFIHDPLYKWALSPLKALQRQKETDDDTDSSLESSQDECEGNKDAARATLRVKQKLDGYEEGELRSVQGQVQQLIQDAIDTDRLCQMFPGWGAWL